MAGDHGEQGGTEPSEPSEQTASAESTASAEPPESSREAAGGTPAGSGSTGGIAIGVMIAGAAAAGPGARAEDRSRRAAAVPQPLPPYTGPPVYVPPGGIGVGVAAGGGLAAGRDAMAVDASTRYVDASGELAAAVSMLREQLRALAPSAETAEVDTELAAAEREIAEDGRVRDSRLQWLRARLDVGATAAAGLASAAAVVQACVQLLG